MAALLGGERVYSNAVSVATQPQPEPPPPPPPPPPQPSITLKAKQVRGLSSYLAVQLDWQLEGEVQVDTWMACRSVGNPNPVYPPDGTGSYAFPCPYEGNIGGYLDEESLYTGYTYHYRIAALYHDHVVLYSNTVSLEISSIIP